MGPIALEVRPGTRKRSDLLNQPGSCASALAHSGRFDDPVASIPSKVHLLFFAHFITTALSSSALCSMNGSSIPSQYYTAAVPINDILAYANYKSSSKSTKSPIP
jgi:hypothetical protein